MASKFSKLIESALKPTNREDPFEGGNSKEYLIANDSDLFPEGDDKNPVLDFIQKSVDAAPNPGARGKGIRGVSLSGTSTNFTHMQPTFGNNSYGYGSGLMQ